MENGVVDHLWLALRKSKHEIANGEWRLALEKTQYQKKQDSLADSPLMDRSVYMWLVQLGSTLVFVKGFAIS